MFNIYLNCILSSLLFWNTYNSLEISKDEYPALVSIVYRGEHQCGGVLVSTNHVLASAHCVSHLPNTIYIFSGVVNTAETWTNGHTLSKIITHPSFDSLTRDYDIALLKLKDPISDMNAIDIIDSDYEFNEENDLAYIFSWEPDNVFQQLTSTTAELLNPGHCSPPGTVTDDGPLDNDKICAEPLGKGCIEDDTAALLYNDTILWGIGSLNENCNDKEKPIVFMNLAKHRDWIDSIRFT